MRDSNLFFNIVVGIVILHFIAGFGYLMYKLSGTPKDEEENATDNQEKE